MSIAQTSPPPTIDTRLRPFEALKAVRRLVANPEDTRQVFLILAALRGRSGHRMFRRFKASATGAAVLREQRVLMRSLSDRAGLMRLERGSLGRAYLAFMLEENLSPEGLANASMTEDLTGLQGGARLFRERMRDSHDLGHVLTGYGRDGLGELCLLAFMFAQTGNLGMPLICLMALGQVPPAHRRAVLGALVEAWRRGRRAGWLPEQDWEALLAQPLEGLRQGLNIAPPVRYQALAQ
jgi:ubiquinone biosynthesis protein COQ4